MTDRTSGQQVRVATLNVLTPLLADWPARRRVIAAQIAETNPDIIALQEVDAGPDRDEELHELLGRDGIPRGIPTPPPTASDWPWQAGGRSARSVNTGWA